MWQAHLLKVQKQPTPTVQQGNLLQQTALMYGAFGDVHIPMEEEAPVLAQAREKQQVTR